MKRLTKLILPAALVAIVAINTVGYARDNVAEEVAWVVGDEPIWRSEIEDYYQQLIYNKQDIPGDPYCLIPEMLAVEKLYLHQAELDTVEVTPSEVNYEVEARINYFIANYGSKEKVEEYFGTTIPQMREQLTEMLTNQRRIQRVQYSLTKDVSVTPSQVRQYVQSLPADSLPWVPLQVEVQFLSINPFIPRQEVDDVKARLRDFTERINRGESDFSTLAILYSEDEGTRSRGGETGFMGRAHLDPEYAAVAFNLNDPTKVSRIVESQYGFHIIQLIEKRGDRVNTRHILLRPRVSDKDLTDAMLRLDSLRTEIVDSAKYTFEEVVPYVSQDKDTRNNKGLMINENTGTTYFEMSQLPAEVARAVASLQPGEISKPFIMKDPKRDADIVVMVKLADRREPHRANIADDYQLLKDMCESAEQSRILNQWLENKIKNTYIRIEEGWRNCTFQHPGWLK